MDQLFTDLDKFSNEYAHALAIIDDRSTFSFLFLKEQVDKASHYFIEQKISSKHRVGLKFSNSALHLINTLALLRIGVAQLSFDNNDSGELINKQSVDCRIDLIVTDQLLNTIQCPQLHINFILLQNFISPALPIPTFNSDKIALLNIGSGTTGEPKIIPLSYSQLHSIIYQRKDLLGVQQGDRFLSLAPFNTHVGKLRTLFALSRALTNVFIDYVNPQLPIMIDRLAIRYLYATDAHADLLMKLVDLQIATAPIINAPRFPLLKALIISGSPLSAQKIQLIKNRLSSRLYLIYATNETSVVSVANPEFLLKKPDSVGMPIPECVVEIVNNQGKVLPVGEIGQIRIQVKGMISHYDSPNENSNAAFVDGWFYPKDLGKLDADGILYFTGRSDDLIIFDGNNVYPREIEIILNNLSDVKESAAFPVKKNDKIVPAVCIQLEADSKLSNNNLSIKYFSEVLEKAMGWKHPRIIQIVEQLPRNKRGKVEKNKLRESLEKQKE